MPIEIGKSGIITCTGDGVELYRLLALRSALSLELHGIKVRRGFSAYAAVKAEFGLKGTKQKVFEQFTLLVDEVSKKVERIREGEVQE